MKIIIIPGLLASTLSQVNDFGIRSFLWAASDTGIATTTALGYINALKLTPDGQSTPGIETISVHRSIETLSNNLKTIAPPNLDITIHPYDWRYSPIDLAPALAAKITEPTILICHSNGCLLALATHHLLKETHSDDLLTGCFFLAGPCGLDSNYTMLQVLAHEGIHYNTLWNGFALQRLFGTLLIDPIQLINGLIVSPRTQIDQLVASFPSLAVQLPPSDRDATWYKTNFKNKSVTDAWLNKGRQDYANIIGPPALPTTKLIQIYGSGILTPTAYTTDAGFLRTNSGDGIVTVKERYNQQQGIFGVWTHNQIVESPDVAQLIITEITGNAFANAEVELPSPLPGGYQYSPPTTKIGSGINVLKPPQIQLPPPPLDP